MLVFLLSAMSMVVNAETKKINIGDFWYNLDTETKTAEVIQYNGSATDVTIP